MTTLLVKLYFVLGMIGMLLVYMAHFRVRLQEIDHKKDIAHHLFGEYQRALDNICLHNSEENRVRALMLGRSYCVLNAEVYKFLALPIEYTEAKIQKDIREASQEETLDLWTPYLTLETP